MVLIDEVTIFAFVLMRMSGCVFFNPIIGRREFPAIVKVGLSLVFSFAIVSFRPPALIAVDSTLMFIVLLLKEFFVGFVIGFVVSLFLYVISFGGELMDLQMGLSMSKVYDPQSNTSMTLSATYYNILFIFIFFAGDGHLNLIRIFIDSAQIIPYGEIAIRPEISTVILDIFCQCTVLAVKFALPMIAIEFVVEMGIGLIMKAIPQINVFVVNIQAKVAIGLILLGVLFVPFANFLENLVVLLFDQIETVMYLF